jgi:4-methylaminobutanoate oxidase (formaldehyde-forming)
VEIARVTHGAEAFTPDGEFILGETSLRGFWVAAGFCVHGLAAAGGVGKVMSEWIVDGTPEYDVAHMDIRRFGPHAASRSWATTKTLDAYSRYYDIVYPAQEWQAARPLRRSATWPRLSTLDACLGEKAGWERVNWFESNAAQGSEALRPTGWAGKIWSPRSRRRCRRRPRPPACSTNHRSQNSTSVDVTSSPSYSACAPTTWTSHRVR